VTDTRTGATVFDSRLVQTTARDYRSATLSPDGLFLADSAHDGLSIVYTRNLATGVEQEAFRDAHGDIDVNAVADRATSVAAYAPGSLFTGPAILVGGGGQVAASFPSPSCRFDASARLCAWDPLTMSADGAYVAYSFTVTIRATTGLFRGLSLADVPARTTRDLSIAHPDLERDPWGPPGSASPQRPEEQVIRVEISGDGNWIGFTGRDKDDGSPRAALLHRITGTTVLAAPALGPTRLLDVSDDARFVLLVGDYSAATGQRLWVVDRVNGFVSQVLDPMDSPLGRYRVLSAWLSGDGGTVVATLGDGSTSDLIAQRTFIARLDTDGDGLHDAWETAFGLNPADASDAALDPDNDGRTNTQEYQDGTHPRGTPVRYFAEGANGTFFATSLALFNPTSAAVTANVRFLGPDGATSSMPVVVPPLGPAFLEADQANLPFTEFSIVVEAPARLVAERRMTWDRDGQYGSHSAAGVDAPSFIWHFAEGATIAGMQTFFLLQNPGDVPAKATLSYLLATGNVQERTHVVRAHSRLTVWANQEGGPLGAAEFSTIVLSDHPVVVERAMYRDAPGETFAAGSVAAGVTAAAASWYFAEGATGTFFDTYLLLSNPNDAAATVNVDFIRAHDVNDVTTALPVQKTYTLAPNSRRTIWVAQEDPALRDTQVGARLTSTRFIVAERTMWWPGPTSATWRENAAEFGSTTSGRLWAVADVQADADDGGWDTFVLVATTEQLLAQVRVTVACDDGTSVSRSKSLSVNRTTLWMRYEFPEIVGRRCAATVESLPSRITSAPDVPLYRTPLVVEKSMYRGHFAAGGVTLATRLPDPP